MKRLELLFVSLVIVLFTNTVIAQEIGSIRSGYTITPPQKLHKLVYDPLPAGTYSVGSGGYFPTIDSAFNKLSIDGIAGEVTLELIDNLYTAPADSFGFLLIGPIQGTNASNRVTIKPAENKNILIVGGGRITISFFNTSYVTIDGFDLTGPTTLTIHTLQNTQYPWNEGIAFLNNSNHNIIQNTIFIGEDYTRTGGGIGVWSMTDTESAPDSNQILGNFIKRAGIGIYVSAYNTGSFTISNGNIIKGNIIGSPTDTLISWGIQVEKNYQTIIENNYVQGIRSSSVNLEGAHGINTYWGISCITRNNTVHNVHSYESTNSTGILLSGGAAQSGSNNMVYNNMIYDIQCLSTQINSRVAGIQLWRQNSPKIYYNSVYLAGTGTNYFGSTCLSVESETDNVEIKNNIFVNMRDESPYCASSILSYMSSNFTSDYNDFCYDDTNVNNCLARIGSVDYHTLGEWQNDGKDLHSYFEMPNFIAPDDLHIDETTATFLESRGIPIAGIETDFDGDLRDEDSTDIGADEFDGVMGVEDETTLPTEFALEQNYPNPFNPTTTIKYGVKERTIIELKVYDILGNEVAALIKEEQPAGYYVLNFNAVNLSSGVYFYQLKAGNFIETKKMLLIK